MVWVKSVTESDYLINLTNMKGHTMAGVTICAKNLYGSVFFPTASPEIWTDGNYTWGFGPNNVTDSAGNPDLHRGLHRCACVHEFYDGNIGELPPRDYGTYNYMVDLLGHPQIRDKTVLYVVDGLYAGDQQNLISPWDIYDGKYSASIFLSQDVIALESVCIDFMRSEPTNIRWVHGNVDNYLHEAAQADDPPSGLVYNPGAEDSPLGSLGVHEHWDGWETKQYSRNLETGDGIELYAVDVSVGMQGREVPAPELWHYPNPFDTRTTIAFTLEREADLKIAVFDASGRMIDELASRIFPSGEHRLEWNASPFSPGTYFCRIRTEDGQVQSIRMQKL